MNFAREFKGKGLPLNMLVENAGVFFVPHNRTQEGFETTVGINYFGEISYRMDGQLNLQFPSLL